MADKIPTFNPVRDFKKYKTNAVRQKKKLSNKFLQSSRWKKLRAIYIATHPLCEVCNEVAEQVHHIKSRKTHPELEFDYENLQALCISCHSKETRREVNEG